MRGAGWYLKADDGEASKDKQGRGWVLLASRGSGSQDRKRRSGIAGRRLSWRVSASKVGCQGDKDRSGCRQGGVVSLVPWWRGGRWQGREREAM